MAGLTHDRRRRIDVLRNRWPTALAIVPWALTLEGGTADGAAGGLGEVLLLLPLPYLIIAKVLRRGLSWPIVVAGLTATVAVRALDIVAPSAVFVAVALIVLVWGAIDGQLHRPGELRVQALGWLGFAVLALVGLAVDPAVGRSLVAAGWFLHGVWDFVHLWRDKVVTRSYAEWCGVVDVLIAAELVLLW